MIWRPISLFHLAGSERRGAPLYSYNDHNTCVSKCDERKSRDGRVAGGMYAINALAPFCLAAGCNDQMRRLWHLQFATDAHATSGEKAIKPGCGLSFPTAVCHLMYVYVNCLYQMWSMVNMRRSATNISVNESDNSQLNESKNDCSQVAIFVCMYTVFNNFGVELMGNKKVKLIQFSCYQTRPACSNKKILCTLCFFPQVRSDLFTYPTLFYRFITHWWYISV